MTQQTRPFFGLTPDDEPGEDTLPEDVWGHGDSQRWWTPDKSDDSIAIPDTSMAEAVNGLPRAMAATVCWEHPLTGEMIPSNKHNAVIDPAKAEMIDYGSRVDAIADLAGADKADVQEIADEHGTDRAAKEFLNEEGRVQLSELMTGDDALYFIPTSSYSIVNPTDFLNPLMDAIEDADLGDEVFGEFRLYNNGGKVSADVFFRGINVEYRDASEDAPIVLGLQVDWDHEGGTSVQARGMGMDHNCSNAIRGVTDELLVKHAGDIDSRVDWQEDWDNMLETLKLKSDHLTQLIHDAMDRTLDLSEMPEDFAENYDGPILEAFYHYAGLPPYLAKHAARNVQAEAENPFNPTWWNIHSGATYAITHHSNAQASRGGELDKQNRTANDMLFNPGRTMEQVNDGYRASKADSETERGTDGKAEIATIGQDLMEAKEQFEEREETIKRLQAQV